MGSIANCCFLTNWSMQKGRSGLAEHPQKAGNILEGRCTKLVNFGTYLPLVFNNLASLQQLYGVRSYLNTGFGGVPSDWVRIS